MFSLTTFHLWSDHKMCIQAWASLSLMIKSGENASQHVSGLIV